jgi:uncharacterized membrane protein YgaE (UPF0421/DUF939 family)
MISFKNLNSLAIAQAVKTGVAAVAALYLTQLLRLPQGYWAAISAIVVMQSEVAATMTASRDRLVGTSIAACTGAVFVAYAGDSVLWFGVAVVLTKLICQSLGPDQSYRLACVTVAIIMLVPQTQSPWILAFHRFTEVALGILIALGVTAVPLGRRKAVGHPVNS